MAVKFCFMLEKNAVKTVLILQIILKDEVLGKIQMYNWFSCFVEIELLISGKPCSGFKIFAF